MGVLAGYCKQRAKYILMDEILNDYSCEAEFFYVVHTQQMRCTVLALTISLLTTKPGITQVELIRAGQASITAINTQARKRKWQVGVT